LKEPTVGTVRQVRSARDECGGGAVVRRSLEIEDEAGRCARCEVPATSTAPAVGEARLAEGAQPGAKGVVPAEGGAPPLRPGTRAAIVRERGWGLRGRHSGEQVRRQASLRREVVQEVDTGSDVGGRARERLQVAVGQADQVTGPEEDQAGAQD